MDWQFSSCFVAVHVHVPVPGPPGPPGAFRLRFGAERDSPFGTRQPLRPSGRVTACGLRVFGDQGRN